jgi:DNA polymerase zeta
MGVAALSRGEHKPDPETDAIAALYYVFHDDDIPLDQTMHPDRNIKEGALLIDHSHIASVRLQGVSVEVVADELDLINRFMDLVYELDPDILAGWEVQTSSWGYLRARTLSYGKFISVSSVRLLIRTDRPRVYGADVSRTSSR